MNNFSCTGRLAKEPDLKTTTSGKNVATFSLAVESGWGDRKKTSFPRFEAWGPQANYISKAHKGDKILICKSELLIEDYQKKDGSKGQAIKFVVSELESAGSRAATQSPSYAPAYQQAQSAPAAVASADVYAPIADDGDLPF